MASFETDFSRIGDLGNIWRRAQQDAARREILSGAQLDGSPQSLAALGTKLVQSGDVQGGMTLAQLAQAAQRDTRDFGFRQQEAQRAQGNTDRSFQLQQQQAAEAARGFDYREIDDGSGGKKLVRIEKATGAISAPPIAGVQNQPNNPFAQPGKMNDEQAKAALYTNRMLSAERVLRGIDASIATDPAEKLRGWASEKTGYNLRSPEFQKFDQARRDFVNATLRRESGAVISDAEFANANQQYFPQPGDTADVLAQKRANRMEAIKGIGGGAGPGYRPDSTFDTKGEIVPNPSRQQPAAAKPIADKAAYDALPSGTPYIAPDGSQRIKK